MSVSKTKDGDARVHATLRLEEVRLAFALGEGVYRRQGSPLYSVLSRQAQYDQELLDLAAHASPGQPPAFHLLSAVHFLTLGTVQHELVGDFSSAATGVEPRVGVFDTFRDFCMIHASQILEILGTTSVQSTSVGRAGFVLPAMDFLYRKLDAPLNLIEVGCSAGLLLMFDRYSYDFGSFGTVGQRAAANVSVKLIGDFARPPAAIPPIATRVGLDLNPIDPADPRSRRWLRALLFPEWRSQGSLLDIALDSTADARPNIVRGDANLLLPELLQRASDPVCVFHSMCLYYFPEEAQARFDAILREASAKRPIHRISVEMAPAYANQARDTAFSGTAAPLREMPAEVTYTAYRDGEPRSEVLALTDRYGAWFEWLGRPS